MLFNNYSSAQIQWQASSLRSSVLVRLFSSSFIYQNLSWVLPANFCHFNRLNKKLVIPWNLNQKLHLICLYEDGFEKPFQLINV